MTAVTVLSTRGLHSNENGAKAVSVSGLSHSELSWYKGANIIKKILASRGGKKKQKPNAPKKKPCLCKFFFPPPYENRSKKVYCECYLIIRNFSIFQPIKTMVLTSFALARKADSHEFTGQYSHRWSYNRQRYQKQMCHVPWSLHLSELAFLLSEFYSCLFVLTSVIYNYLYWYVKNMKCYSYTVHVGTSAR